MKENNWYIEMFYYIMVYNDLKIWKKNIMYKYEFRYIKIKVKEFGGKIVLVYFVLVSKV